MIGKLVAVVVSHRDNPASAHTLYSEVVEVCGRDVVVDLGAVDIDQVKIGVVPVVPLARDVVIKVGEVDGEGSFDDARIDASKKWLSDLR